MFSPASFERGFFIEPALVIIATSLRRTLQRQIFIVQ